MRSLATVPASVEALSRPIGPRFQSFCDILVTLALKPGDAMLLSTGIRELPKDGSLQAIVDATLAQALELSTADLGNVQLMDWQTACLEIVAQHGFGREFLTFFKQVTALGGSACARALRSGESIIVEDVEYDEAFAQCRAIARRAGFRAVQSTPLIATGGATVGMLSTHFPSPRRPSDATMGTLKRLARSAADAIIFYRAVREDVGTMVARSHQAVADSRRILRLVDDTMNVMARPAPKRDG